MSTFDIFRHCFGLTKYDYRRIWTPRFIAVTGVGNTRAAAICDLRSRLAMALILLSLSLSDFSSVHSIQAAATGVSFQCICVTILHFAISWVVGAAASYSPFLGRLTTMEPGFSSTMTTTAAAKTVAVAAVSSATLSAWKWFLFLSVILQEAALFLESTLLCLLAYAYYSNTHSSDAACANDVALLRAELSAHTLTTCLLWLDLLGACVIPIMWHFIPISFATAAYVAYTLPSNLPKMKSCYGIDYPAVGTDADSLPARWIGMVIAIALALAVAVSMAVAGREAVAKCWNGTGSRNHGRLSENSVQKCDNCALNDAWTDVYPAHFLEQDTHGYSAWSTIFRFLGKKLLPLSIQQRLMIVDADPALGASSHELTGGTGSKLMLVGNGYSASSSTHSMGSSSGLNGEIRHHNSIDDRYNNNINNYGNNQNYYYGNDADASRSFVAVASTGSSRHGTARPIINVPGASPSSSLPKVDSYSSSSSHGGGMHRGGSHHQQQNQSQRVEPDHASHLMYNDFTSGHPTVHMDLSPTDRDQSSSSRSVPSGNGGIAMIRKSSNGSNDGDAQGKPRRVNSGNLPPRWGMDGHKAGSATSSGGRHELTGAMRTNSGRSGRGGEQDASTPKLTASSTAVTSKPGIMSTWFGKLAASVQGKTTPKPDTVGGKGNGNGTPSAAAPGSLAVGDAAAAAVAASKWAKDLGRDPKSASFNQLAALQRKASGQSLNGGGATTTHRHRDDDAGSASSSVHTYSGDEDSDHDHDVSGSSRDVSRSNRSVRKPGDSSKSIRSTSDGRQSAGPGQPGPDVRRHASASANVIRTAAPTLIIHSNDTVVSDNDGATTLSDGDRGHDTAANEHHDQEQLHEQQQQRDRQPEPSPPRSSLMKLGSSRKISRRVSFHADIDGAAADAANNHNNADGAGSGSGGRPDDSYDSGGRYEGRSNDGNDHLSPMQTQQSSRRYSQAADGYGASRSAAASDEAAMYQSPMQNDSNTGNQLQQRRYSQAGDSYRVLRSAAGNDDASYLSPQQNDAINGNQLQQQNQQEQPQRQYPAHLASIMAMQQQHQQAQSRYRRNTVASSSPEQITMAISMSRRQLPDFDGSGGAGGGYGMDQSQYGGGGNFNQQQQQMPVQMMRSFNIPSVNNLGPGFGQAGQGMGARRGSAVASYGGGGGDPQFQQFQQQQQQPFFQQQQQQQLQMNPYPDGNNAYGQNSAGVTAPLGRSGSAQSVHSMGNNEGAGSRNTHGNSNHQIQPGAYPDGGMAMGNMGNMAGIGGNMGGGGYGQDASQVQPFAMQQQMQPQPMMMPVAPPAVNLPSVASSAFVKAVASFMGPRVPFSQRGANPLLPGYGMQQQQQPQLQQQVAYGSQGQMAGFGAGQGQFAQPRRASTGGVARTGGFLPNPQLQQQPGQWPSPAGAVGPAGAGLNGFQAQRVPFQPPPPYQRPQLPVPAQQLRQPFNR